MPIPPTDKRTGDGEKGENPVIKGDGNADLPYEGMSI